MRRGLLPQLGVLLALLAVSLDCVGGRLSFAETPSYSIDGNTITITATLRNDDPVGSGPLFLEVLAQQPTAGAEFFVRLSDVFEIDALGIGQARSVTVSSPVWWPPENLAYDVVLWLREYVGQPAEFIDGTIVRADYHFGPRDFVAPKTALENPAHNSFQSGIGLISGWSCIGPRVAVSIDDREPVNVPYGSSRRDAAGECSGDENTGFGLLTNFNLLGSGIHTIQLWAAGWKRGTPHAFTVTVPNGEFIRGLSSSVIVPNFPVSGRNARLIWQESQQNFAIESVTP